MELFNQNPHLVFYAILVGAMLIIRIPFIGKYFRTVNTLLHESGHAIAAILTSGEVVEIKLSSDTSGSAYTKSGSRGRAMLVSFAGYPFAAIFSGFMLAMAISNQYRTFFVVLFSVALLNLVLFVRNSYGIAWIITFSGLIFFVFWLGNEIVSYLFTLAVSLISLSETVFSTLTILYLGFAYPRKAGDLTNLAKISKVPAAIWALITSIVVAVTVYFIVLHYFPYPLKPIR